MASSGSALAQLRERDYAAKYRGDGERTPAGSTRSGGRPSAPGGGWRIHLIGVEFSRETRNVTAFEVADG